MPVSARGLSRIYGTSRGPIVAVEGVDLEIGRGEFLAITGRSGSGKSTLLGMIGGLCRPTSGSVIIDGTDLRSLSPPAMAEFRARRLGFLFQFAGLLPSLRAVDNVALPAMLSGVPQAEAFARAGELLGQVGLSGRWDAYPAELSGGQQRRVAVARALINRPVLLLADEPTNDLDEQAEREVLGLLLDLHRAHSTTLVVVTHDPDLAARADRVVTLRSGRLARSACPAPVASIAQDRSAWIGADADTETNIEGPFEAGPETLVEVEPTAPGAGLGRFLVGFLGWVAVAAGVMYAADTVSGRFQKRAIERRVVQRKKSEILAMQQLRADLNDVSERPDGSYEVSLYLQNFEPGKPFFVLGPEVRAFVQVDRTWQPVSIVRSTEDTARVREVGADRRSISYRLRIDAQKYDELIPGYFHVRITSEMIVSQTAEPTDDLFERTDDYYVYLKPRGLTEDEIRLRNRWKPGAIVPRWISMPAH